MARGLNKVMIIGNLGKDPEMKYNAEGKPITTFSVAVSRTWKAPDGQANEETEWFRVVAWERLAETCNEYLRKGSKVYIEGRLKTRKWTAPDGQERQMTEVIASDMQMLDSRQQSGYGDESGGGGGGYRNDRPAPQRQGSQGGTPAAAAGGSGQSYEDTDMDVDDIPF
jgi:single-strand DNA-binding protein